MSDEEKKAIDLLKNIDKQKCLMLNCPVVKNNIERQLKIIELNRIIRKQSKEIEELKEEDDANLAYYDQIYQSGIYTGQKAVEDKIKAKIEPRLKEIDEQMKKEWKEYGNSRKYQDMEDEWNFLQSLLEKE